MAGTVYLEGEVTELSEAQGDYELVQVFSVGTTGPPASDAAEYAIASGSFILASAIRTYRHIQLSGSAETVNESFGNMSVGHILRLSGFDCLQENWSEGRISIYVPLHGEEVELVSEAFGEFYFSVALEGEAFQATEATGDFEMQLALSGVAYQISEGHGLMSKLSRLFGEVTQVSFGESAHLREITFLEGDDSEQLSKGCGEFTTRGETHTYRYEYLEGESVQGSYSYYASECGTLFGAHFQTTARLHGSTYQLSHGENIRNDPRNTIRVTSYLRGEATQYNEAECSKIILDKHFSGLATWISESIGRIPLIKVLLFQQSVSTIASKSVGGDDYDIVSGRDKNRIAVTSGVGLGFEPSHPEISIHLALFGVAAQWSEADGYIVVEDHLFGEGTQFFEADGSFKTFKYLKGETYRYSLASGFISEEQLMEGESFQVSEGDPAPLQEWTALYGDAELVTEGFNNIFITEAILRGVAEFVAEVDLAPIRMIYYGFKGLPTQYNESVNTSFSSQVFIDGLGENVLSADGFITLGKALFAFAEQVSEADLADLRENTPLYGVTEQLTYSEGYCTTHKALSGVAEQAFVAEPVIMVIHRFLTGTEPVRMSDGIGSALFETIAGGQGDQVFEASGLMSLSTILEPVTDPSIELYNF